MYYSKAIIPPILVFLLNIEILYINISISRHDNTNTSYIWYSWIQIIIEYDYLR